MFKKSDSSKRPDPLAERMRQVTGRTVSDDSPQIDMVSAGGRAPRKPTFKTGTITTATGERMDVVVKNISDSGARIDFFRKIQLSEHITLSEPTLRIKRRARVMWQTDCAAGVRFVDP